MNNVFRWFTLVEVPRCEGTIELIRDWCWHNIGTEEIDWSLEVLNNVIKVYFNTPIDAFMFKRQWINDANN
jgi:hypothetical protein